MIKRLKSGNYVLAETPQQTKILILDGKAKYAWIHAEEAGDILVSTQKKIKLSSILSAGTYRIYDVENESDFTDLKHIELFVGDGKWQGYLLPTGLPNGKIRRKIIPTFETITKTTH